MPRALIALFAFVFGFEPALGAPAREGGKAMLKKRRSAGRATQASKARPTSRKRGRGSPRLALANRRQDRSARRASSRRRARQPKRRKLRRPLLSLVHANTGQRLSVSLFNRRGRIDRRALKQIYRFMRCRATGRIRPIALRLLSNLYRISRNYSNKPVYVYSGYRARRTTERRGGYHTRGRAVDFRIPGVDNRRLRDFVRRTFARVGVGYYPNSYFVHMDVREKRSAFWVDFSGPGEPADYARDAKAVLAAEREGKKLSNPAEKRASGVTRGVVNASCRDAKIKAGPPPLGPMPEISRPARIPGGIPPAAPW